MSSSRSTTRPRRAFLAPRTWGSFFRNPETGELVIAQLPNPPLIAWLVGRALQLVVHDNPLLEAATLFALVWWAILEVVEGESPFRRVLGGVVLIAATIGPAVR